MKGDFMFKRNLPTQMLSACSLLLLVLAMAGYAIAQSNVTICHATGSASNPYEEITTANPAIINAHIGDPPGTGHPGDFLVSGPGQCPDGGTGPTAVPEPITMLLFGAGLAGVGYAKRRMGRKEVE
jgi:hypothetical protein